MFVTVNDLELTVEEDSEYVLGVCGYSPYHGWIEAPLTAPPALPGLLRVRSARPLLLGVAERVTDDDALWPVYVDPDSRWVCYGSVETASGAVGLEFAPGAIAVLRAQRLISLWLRPEALPAAFVRDLIK